MSDIDSVALAGLDERDIGVLRTFVSEDFSFLRTAAACGVDPEQVKAIVLGQKKAVTHLLASRADQTNASRDTAIAMLWSIATFDPLDMIDLRNDRPLHMKDWPYNLRMAVEESSYSELTGTWKFKFASRSTILTTLLKYFSDPELERRAPAGVTAGTIGTATFNIIGHQQAVVTQK